MTTLWSRLVQWLSLRLQGVLGINTNQLHNGPREIGRDIKCPKCTKSFGHPTVYTFFSDINIEDLLKKKSIDEKIAFKKLFCALLNGQEANLVIFHVTDCRIVDLFDRKVNDILESLIPDGYDYQHKFERRDYDTEHFGVRVKPSKDNESCILSTIDFHTCFSRDKGLNKQPNHMVMQNFLKKAKHDSDTKQTLPKKDDFSVNQELLIDRNIPFTENVYRQAKGFEHGANGNESRKENEKLGERQAKRSQHGANGNESRKWKEKLGERQAKRSQHGAHGNESRKENEKLGERQAKRSEHGANGNEPRKWKEKLKEYISAFSKVPGGGTLYFGVDEETVEKHCELTRFICKGVHLNKEQKESWKTFCNEKMKEMLWVAHNQTRSTPGIEVDFIRPKNSHEDSCVIIVKVEQFKGVGFLRRDGPESYELDENDNPTEVKPWAKWARLSRCKDLVVVSTD